MLDSQFTPYNKLQLNLNEKKKKRKETIRKHRRKGKAFFHKRSMPVWTDAEAEAPIIWPLDAKSQLIEKTLMLGKIEVKRRGWQRMRWL